MSDEKKEPVAQLPEAEPPSISKEQVAKPPPPPEEVVAPEPAPERDAGVPDGAELRRLEREQQAARREMEGGLDEVREGYKPHGVGARDTWPDPWHESFLFGAGVLRRFLMVKAGDHAIRVYEGLQTRNGVTADLELDSGKSYESLTIPSGASTTYYITVSLTATTYDPALAPDTTDALDLTAETAEPVTDTYSGKRVIGTVTNDGSGNISLITQRWLGDIKDTVVRPDANSWSATDPWTRTIETNPTDNAHYGEAQLANAQDVAASTYGLPFLAVDGNASGALAWGVLDADLGGAGSGTQKSIERRTSGSDELFQWYAFDSTDGSYAGDADTYVAVRNNTGPVVDYMGLAAFADWVQPEIIIDGTSQINPAPYHKALDFALGTGGVSGNNTDHDDQYPGLGYAYNQAVPSDGVHFLSIGRTKASLAIDLTNSQLNDGAADTLDWALKQLIGNWDVTGTTEAQSGDGAIDIPDGGIYAGDGGYFDKGAASQALYGSDGTRYAKAGTGSEALYATDGTRIAKLGDGSQAGFFDDTTHYTEIANGAYCLEAHQGDINIDVSQYYRVGGTPVVGAQVTARGLITDNSGGGVDSTLVAISGSGDDANINNNFADLADKINDIITNVLGTGAHGLSAD